MPMWFLACCMSSGPNRIPVTVPNGSNSIVLTKTTVVALCNHFKKDHTMDYKFSVVFCLLQKTNDVNNDNVLKYSNEEYFLPRGVSCDVVYDYFKMLNGNNSEVDRMDTWKDFIPSENFMFFQTSDKWKDHVKDVNAKFFDKHNGYLSVLVADGQHRLYVLACCLYGEMIFNTVDPTDINENTEKILRSRCNVSILDVARPESEIYLHVVRSESNKINSHAQLSVINHGLAIITDIDIMIKSSGYQSWCVEEGYRSAVKMRHVGIHKILQNFLNDKNKVSRQYS